MSQTAKDEALQPHPGPRGGGIVAGRSECATRGVSRGWGSGGMESARDLAHSKTWRNTKALVAAVGDRGHSVIAKSGVTDPGYKLIRFAGAGGLPQTLPQQCLYFLPLPQGQGSLRPTLGPVRTGAGRERASEASVTMSLARPPPEEDVPLV